MLSWILGCRHLFNSLRIGTRSHFSFFDDSPSYFPSQWDLCTFSPTVNKVSWAYLQCRYHVDYDKEACMRRKTARQDQVKAGCIREGTLKCTKVQSGNPSAKWLLWIKARAHTMTWMWLKVDFWVFLLQTMLNTLIIYVKNIIVYSFQR